MADIASTVQAYEAHVAEIEDRYDVELDKPAREWLLRQSLENGFTPEATEAAFAELAGDSPGSDGGAPAALIESAIESAAEGLGRPVLRAERDAIVNHIHETALDFSELPPSVAGKHLGEAATEALARHHEQVDWPTDPHQQRVALATQRLHEQENPRPEDDESLDNLDPDDSKEDRLRYAVAKHIHGVEFEDVDDDQADEDEPGLEDAA